MNKIMEQLREWTGGGPRTSKLMSGFELTTVIGSGSFGLVVKVEDKFNHKYYAVKLVATTAAGGGKLVKIQDLSEFKSLAQLPLHKNVVTYLAFWQDKLSTNCTSQLRKIVGTLPLGNACRIFSTCGGQKTRNIFCMQMEFCGPNLKNWLQQRTVVAESKCIDIFLQICSGLEHIHAHNLIHHNLKPENIFISAYDSRVIKIGDFGITADQFGISSAESALLRAPPTALYLAPEHGTAKYGKGADLHALGLILFELFDPSLQLSSVHLHQGLLQLKLRGTLPEQLTTGWPKIAELIRQLVAVEPDQRPNLETIQTSLKLKPKAWILQQQPAHQLPNMLFKGCHVCGNNNKLMMEMDQNRNANTARKGNHPQRVLPARGVVPASERQLPVPAPAPKSAMPPFSKQVVPTVPLKKSCNLNSQKLAVDGAQGGVENKSQGQEGLTSSLFCGSEKRIEAGKPQFYHHNGKIYCEEDYFPLIGKMCAGCKKPIKGICLNWGSEKWHPDCRACEKCGEPIVDSLRYQVENDKIRICDRCFFSW